MERVRETQVAASHSCVRILIRLILYLGTILPLGRKECFEHVYLNKHVSTYSLNLCCPVWKPLATGGHLSVN